MAYDKVKYDNEYIKAHYDSICAILPKDEHIPELINIAIEQGISQSKTAYVIRAIKNRLIKDGLM